MDKTPTASATRKAPASRPVLAFILVTVCLDSMGLGIIIPVTPHLIVELSGEDLAAAATYGGWLMFLYALTQFFCAPVLGNLSDRFGRRPVLLASLAAYSLDYLIMGFAPSLLWLFIGRGLAGLAGATYATANAYMADVSLPEHKAQNFGLLSAAWGLGFILGPLLGGVLGDLGPRVPFFAASAVAALNLLYGSLILPETLSKSERRPFSLRRANPVGAVLQISHRPLLPGLLGVFVLLQIAHDANPSVWTYYNIEKFNWTPAQIGFSLAVVGVGITLVSAFLIRWCIPRFGEVRTAYAGLTLLAGGYLGYALAPWGWLMYVFSVPFAMGGLAFPALRSIMSNGLPPDSQGELQGALSSVAGLTAIFAPLLMTNLFGYFSRSDGWLYFPGAAFFVAGSLVALALLRFRRTMTRHAATA